MMSDSNSTFALLLRKLVHAVCRYPRRFIYPQFLLAALCLVYAVQGLRLDMDRDHLIGPKVKSQQIYLAFEKQFPNEGNDLVVAVESGHSERTRQFIERLAAKLKSDTNLFSDLFYKADLTTLGPKGLLLASTNHLKDLSHTLGNYRPLIAQFSQATNLDSLFSFVNEQFRGSSMAKTKEAESLVDAIPFMRSVISQAMQGVLRPGKPPPPEVESLLAGGPQGEEQIYITVDKGRTYLLTARPRSADLTSAAIERLRQLIQATQVEVPGVDVGLTGGPVLDYDEMRQAEHDTAKARIVAFILCAVLFIFAYRQLWRPVKTAICLLIGLGYTLGFTTLAVGHLNILTITFAPMLIGLAIDFGIHFISRYEEEMRNQRTEAEAIERASIFTGQGIVTGALTTAAAFLAMALTHFKGIQEMGVISGCGLLLCLVPMMTTLPVLLMHGRQNLRDREIGPAGQRRLQIEFLWLKHPLIVIAASMLLCLGAALQFHHLFFDYDLLHMQSQALPSVIYEKAAHPVCGRLFALWRRHC